MYYDDSCQLTDDLGSVDFKTNGLTQLKPPFKVVENTGFHPKFTSWKLNFQFSSSLWRETEEEVPFLSFFRGKKSCSGSMLHLTTCLGESLWIMAERLVVVSNHLWWFFGWFTAEPFRPDHQDGTQFVWIQTLYCQNTLRWSHFGVTNCYPVFWNLRFGPKNTWNQPTTAPDLVGLLKARSACFSGSHMDSPDSTTTKMLQLAIESLS